MYAYIPEPLKNEMFALFDSHGNLITHPFTSIPIEVDVTSMTSSHGYKLNIQVADNYVPVPVSRKPTANLHEPYVFAPNADNMLMYTTPFGVNAFAYNNKQYAILHYMLDELVDKTQAQQREIHKAHLCRLQASSPLRTTLHKTLGTHAYDPSISCPLLARIPTARGAIMASYTFPYTDGDNVLYYPTIKHAHENKRVKTSARKYLSVLEQLDIISEDAVRTIIEEYNIATAHLTVKIDNTVEWFQEIYSDPRTPSCMGGKSEGHFKQLPVEAYCYEGSPFSLAAVYADDVLVARALCVLHDSDNAPAMRYSNRCYTNGHVKSRMDDIKQALQDKGIHITDYGMTDILNGKRLARIDVDGRILFPYVDPKGLAAIVYPDRLELTKVNAMAATQTTSNRYPGSEGFVLPIHNTGLSPVNRWPGTKSATDTPDDLASAGLDGLQSIYDDYMNDRIGIGTATALVNNDMRLVCWARNEDNALHRILSRIGYAHINDEHVLYADPGDEDLVVLDDTFYRPHRVHGTTINYCALESEAIQAENGKYILLDDARSTYDDGECHVDDDNYVYSVHHQCRIPYEEAYYIESYDDNYHTDLVVKDYNGDPQLEDDCICTPDGRYYLKDDLDL